MHTTTTAEALKPRYSHCAIASERKHPSLTIICDSPWELEALAVNDAGTTFIVFGLGDPHLLEGGQGGKDGATNPHGVLALRGCYNLDLHGGRSKGRELLGHALTDSLEHSGTAGKYDVGVEVLTDIYVALHDGLEGAIVDARSFLSDEGRLEEDFWGTEALVANSDHVSVGKLVGLVDGGRFLGGLHLLVEVKGDVAELFLDVTDDFTFGGGGETVATLSEDLHHVVGEIATGKVETDDGVGKGVTFVDGHGVGDTITRVKHATGGTARGIQGEDCLDVDVHSGAVEGFEHDLGHALTVGLGVKRGLGEKNWVLLGGYTKLVIESVMPDLLHVIPVRHDTMLDRVLEGKNTTLGLGLVTDVGVLLVHANHDSGVLRASDDGGEDGARSIVTGEASLAHARAIVYYERLYVFVVTHDKSM